MLSSGVPPQTVPEASSPSVQVLRSTNRWWLSPHRRKTFMTFTELKHLLKTVVRCVGPILTWLCFDCTAAGMNPNGNCVCSCSGIRLLQCSHFFTPILLGNKVPVKCTRWALPWPRASRNKPPRGPSEAPCPPRLPHAPLPLPNAAPILIVDHRFLIFLYGFIT